MRVNSAAIATSQKRGALSAATALVLAALVLCGLDLAALPSVSAAPAATCTWNPGQGVWSDASRWGGGLTTIDVSATGIISRQYPSGAGNPDNGLRRPIWNRGVVTLTGGTVGSDAAAYAVFTNTGTFNALKGVFYPASIRNEGLLVK